MLAAIEIAIGMNLALLKNGSVSKWEDLVVKFLNLLRSSMNMVDLLPGSGFGAQKVKAMVNTTFKAWQEVEEHNILGMISD